MTDQDWSKTRTFVPSLSYLPMLQCTASTNLQSNVHTIQLKGSMENVYTQAKDSLQQGESHESSTAYNASASLKAQGKPRVHWDVSSEDQQGNEYSYGRELHLPEKIMGPIVKMAMPASDDGSEQLASAGNCVQSYNVPTQISTKTNWKTSFALSSTSKPIGSYYKLHELELEQSVEGYHPTKQIGDGSLDADLEESLLESFHANLQQLQARIASLLKDCPP
eukprot:Gb_01564 [translate_table: standard]